MSLLKRFSNNRSRKSPTIDAPQPDSRSIDASITCSIDALSIQDEETLIAVVGVTGSGKSSFIKRATGRDDIEIGEGLCSMTQSVKEYSYVVAGKKFKLIDTPGFDDTEVDDEDIFEALVEWLEKSYRKNQRLTGLLYLHRIISNREKGSDLRNLRVFQKLCGDNSFSNVIIGITWWDKEDAEVADSREKVLRGSDEFWGGMVKKGAQVVRMPLNQQGCVDLLMNLSKRQATTLAIQDEIVNQGKSAKDTVAASALHDYDKFAAARDSDRLDQLAADLRLKAHRLQQEQEAARRLAEERAKYEEEDERLLAEAEALLAQKRKEADAFRERTEARRKRMEEIQRQLREAEEHVGGASQDYASPEPLSPQISNPPPAYERRTSVPLGSSRDVSSPQLDDMRFSVNQLTQLREEQEKKAEALLQKMNQERRDQEAAVRLEEERRAKVLAEQMERHQRAQEEARRLDVQREERDRLQKVAEEIRKAKEETERRLREEMEKKKAEEERKQREAEASRVVQQRDAFEQAYTRLLAQMASSSSSSPSVAAAALARTPKGGILNPWATDTAREMNQSSALAQTPKAGILNPWATDATREMNQISARTERHLASCRAAILQFGMYAKNQHLHQSWQGSWHEYDGVLTPGPIQNAFCDICMVHLPHAHGYWLCRSCTIFNSGLAMCVPCKTQRSGRCFNSTHRLEFVPWSPSIANGPFSTCSRLREPKPFTSLICSLCQQNLSVVFLHCCLCDNDDFDMCLTCWGERNSRCRGYIHKLWVNVWTPPDERALTAA